MHTVVLIIPLWTNIFYANREPTIWLQKDTVRCTTRFYFRTIDVSQIKSNLFLSSIDSCLMYQHRDVEEIEKQLRKYFENIYDWFIDNRLSVNFREDKTKPIVFLSKCKIQSARKLNVKNKDIKINNTRR